MKKFFKFGSKGLKRSPSETSNQSSSWSLNSGGSKDSLGKSSSSDFKEKDFHKIHKAALNGDLEKLKEHLKKQSVDLTGLWFYSYDSTLITQGRPEACTPYTNYRGPGPRGARARAPSEKK